MAITKNKRNIYIYIYIYIHSLALDFLKKLKFKTQYFFPYSTCCYLFDEILFNIDYVIRKIK